MDAGAAVRAGHARAAHEAAWQRIESVRSRFGGLSGVAGAAAVAHATLSARSRARRRSVQALAVLLLAGGAAYTVEQRTPWRQWAADHRTRPGEQRRIVLADGSALVLNTDTAINVRFAAGERRIVLLRGEIFVATANDPGRRFLVEMPQGLAQALGTQFSVHSEAQRAVVRVFEGAVEITPAQAGSQALVLRAGQGADLSAQSAGSPRPVGDADRSWVHGTLIAKSMRLADLLAQLKVTPYGGVIYDLNAQWSAYASYSSIFKPQALMMSGPLPGAPLAPIKGRSYEAGVKGELLDGKLNATFSVFNVERTGTAVLDTRYTATPSLWGAACCYLPQGKVTSQGFDVEVGGQLAAGWQVAAGYTFNETRDKTENKVFSSITPRHLLKLSTAYTLPGEWSRWRLGGSARVQSAQFVSGTVTGTNGASQPYDFTQPGHAIWDLLLQYRIDPNWSLGLNVNNVLDKRYYQTVGTVFSGNMQGLPRNAMLTLRGKF